MKNLRSRWRGVWWWAGLVCLVAIPAGLVMVLRAQGLQDAANVAQLISVALALVALTGELLRVRRRPSSVNRATLADAKEELARRVAQQWRDEELRRSLHAPDPMPVRWRVTRTPGLMDHSTNVVVPSLLLNASSDDIPALAVEFQSLRRRRLVILGEPGSGKTTLAVQLLRELMARRTPDEPVPVLLPAAGWDVSKHPDLYDWVSHRMREDYPALMAPEFAGVLADLASGRHLLPIIDGLDEVPVAAQAAAITALNRSLGGEEQLIITSRIGEFIGAVEQAGGPIRSALVREAIPITPNDAARYLRRCLPHRGSEGWETVLDGLQAASDSALAEVVSNALGLWLLRAVYIEPRLDPRPLLDTSLFGDATAIRAHLFDQLIPSAIATWPPATQPANPYQPRRTYDPSQVRLWLASLARLNARDLAWWNIATTELITLPLILAYASLCGLAMGSVTALAIGFLMTPIAGVVVGLVMAIAAGTWIGIAMWYWPGESPGFVELRLWRQSRHILRNCYLAVTAAMTKPKIQSSRYQVPRTIPKIAIVAAIPVAVTDPERLSTVPDSSTDAWGEIARLGIVAVGGAALTALTLVFLREIVGAMERPTRLDWSSTPMSSWHADRALTLLRGVIVGLLFAAPIAGWMGVLFGGRTALVIGGLAALLGTLIGILVIGRHHAWLAYIVANRRLAHRGHAPPRLMPFLDDAHRLGLLRAVGPVYQFRHTEFRNHLARTVDTDQSTVVHVDASDGTGLV